MFSIVLESYNSYIMSQILVLGPSDSTNLFSAAFLTFVSSELACSDIKYLSVFEPLASAYPLQQHKVIVLLLQDFEIVVKKIRQLRDMGVQGPITIVNFFDLDLNKVKTLRTLSDLVVCNINTPAHEFLKLLDTQEPVKFLLCSYNSNQIVKSFLEDDFMPEGMPGLSKVECEIIDCAEKGFSITQSAEYLGRSPNTIAVYRSKIIKKFNCSSINQVCVKLKRKEQHMHR